MKKMTKEESQKYAEYKEEMKKHNMSPRGWQFWVGQYRETQANLKRLAKRTKE